MFSIIDDSTGTVRVLLSARTCRRFDFPELKTSEVVTIIGTLDRRSSGETVVRCAGYVGLMCRATLMLSNNIDCNYVLRLSSDSAWSTIPWWRQSIG
ncbi:hypothetical protein BCR43DRAFT_483560 [Syncephalastrum racemosum]|uniref:OB domain-containing protein n=1 Tax=Syncephalastrum racemosum TaxID=13706 RepID=A0A1X2HVK3_SYNRA|nr:hypothetical protein BCR43DRAFT_483560 [Syncephalastrum racemosum]